MIIIGLTGSIAMGKSEVAKIFKNQGVPVFDSDLEVHRLYASSEGAKLLEPIVPGAILNESIDREKLSKLVLQDPTLLAKVEKLVHKEIATSREIFISESLKAGMPIVVLDIPLLFETAADKQVDLTIVISSPEKSQHERAMARSGMTPDKLNLILARQMPDSEKRKRANYVIENLSSLDELSHKTKVVLSHIRKNQKP